MRILSIYRPSEARLQLGGDFYDVLRLPDDSLALIVGDVAGHGPQAAALGARLRAGWRALRLAGTPVDQILRSLDTMVAENDPAGEMFATVCLAQIDHAAGQAQVVCCGHAPPLLVSAGDISMLDVSPGPALGPFGLDGHRPTTIDLPDGWVLFVYTDGLTEARLSPGETERLGEEGLMRKLGDDPTYLADADGLARLLDEVEQANGEPLADDVAVVAVEIAGVEAGGPGARGRGGWVVRLSGGAFAPPPFTVRVPPRPDKVVTCHWSHSSSTKGEPWVGRTTLVIIGDGGWPCWSSRCSRSRRCRSERRRRSRGRTTPTAVQRV